MNTAVEVYDLSVILDKRVQALKNVSVSFPVGKTIGVIGPSGAGKTTLIKSIVGRIRISSGSIAVFDLPAGSLKLREDVTYMTQELSVYSDLTVRENIRYFAIMSGLSRKNVPGAIDAILSQVDLEDKADVLVSNLSGGQKQRASLSIALIGAPKLMVLDEPTVGLDPVLREKLWDLFHELAKGGTTLIISSHSMDEAERCDDLVLLREGEVISHSSPEKLKEQTHTKTIEGAFLKLVGSKE